MEAINTKNDQLFKQPYNQREKQTELASKMISMQNDEIRQLLDDDKTDFNEWQAQLVNKFRVYGVMTQLATLNVGNLDAVQKMHQEAETKKAQMDMAIRIQTAAARFAEMGQRWQVMTDPNRKDDSGNPIQHLFNPADPTNTKTLTGEPYKPSGAQKLSSSQGGHGRPRSGQIDRAGIIAGNKQALTGMARNSANMGMISNEIARQAKAAGMDGAAIAALQAEFQGMVAGERTLGTRTANVGMAVASAQKLMPLALAASEKVDRSRQQALVENKARGAVSKQFVAGVTSRRGTSGPAIPQASWRPAQGVIYSTKSGSSRRKSLSRSSAR